MRWTYLINRLVFLVLVIWSASTVNFFLPRISGQDPIRTRMVQQMGQGVEVDKAGMGERQRPLRVDQKVLVGRRDEDRALLEPVALLRLPHPKLGPAPQDGGELALVGPVEVLDDHHRRGKVSREGGKELGEGGEATRRGPDGDDLQAPRRPGHVTTDLP